MNTDEIVGTVTFVFIFAKNSFVKNNVILNPRNQLANIGMKLCTQCIRIAPRTSDFTKNCLICKLTITGIIKPTFICVVSYCSDIKMNPNAIRVQIFVPIIISLSVRLISTYIIPVGVWILFSANR